MRRVRYQMQFPADLALAEILDFTRALATRPRHGLFGQADPVVFEMVATQRRVSWYVEASEREAPTILRSIRANLPRVRYEPVQALLPPPYERGLELGLNDQQRALRTDVAEQSSRAVLSAVQGLDTAEALAVQWLVGPWLPRRAVPPSSRRSDDIDVLLHVPGPRRDSEQVAALRRKQQEAVFGAVGRLLVRADSVSRQRQLLQRLLGALQIVRDSGVGFRRRLVITVCVPARAARQQRPFIAWPNVLSAVELASVLGWPIGGPILNGVTYGGQRQLAAPDGALVQRVGRHRITGRATYAGRAGYLHLPSDQARRHLWAVGPTGSGKTTLLANLALQDIRDGRGVVVLDPTGDLVTSMLERVPHHRADDVVVLDAADRSRPVGLNPLRGDPELAVDAVLHILRELYAANWGPRTSDILHAGLLTLARQGGYTLCELPALLTQAAFRRSVISSARRDTLGLGPFWSWYEGLSPAEMSTVIGPVMNKLRAFTLRSSLRNVLGQVDGFDLQRVFTERKVLLVNLATGEIGTEAAQLLGALLIGQLWQVIQRRSAIPAERRHVVPVYLDEFQRYLRLPSDLSDVLVRARGLGIALTLAHQHLGQLTPGVRSAVVGNARSRIVWQTAHDDAVPLAKILGGGLTAADLQNLGPFETYQALCVGGTTGAPASAVTLPLPAPERRASELWAQSRLTYGVAVEAVEQSMQARRQASAAGGPIGSRRRQQPEASS